MKYRKGRKTFKTEELSMFNDKVEKDLAKEN